ncbi:MAG: hypothetical protein K9M81_03545 [Chthoniobacterales bacterium]|nr:hypothetical protein [Chthoniobacterales bacterium]
MDTALISKPSSGSVHTHSRRQTSSLALPHQPSRPPHDDQYEISGFRRFFLFFIIGMLCSCTAIDKFPKDAARLDNNLNKGSGRLIRHMEHYEG